MQTFKEKIYFFLIFFENFLYCREVGVIYPLLLPCLWNWDGTPCHSNRRLIIHPEPLIQKMFHPKTHYNYEHHRS